MKDIELSYDDSEGQAYFLVLHSTKGMYKNNKLHPQNK